MPYYSVLQAGQDNCSLLSAPRALMLSYSMAISLIGF